MAVTDWLAEGLPGRAAKTVEVYADALRPVLTVIGRIPLRDLTVQDVRTALAKMAVTHSTPTLQKAHNCLTRALRHAEGRDLVRRNVSALVDTPHGRQGRPSQALTVEQAAALLEAAEDSRLHAYIVLCLLTGVRSEEARALTWDHVDLDARTISVWRSSARMLTQSQAAALAATLPFPLGSSNSPLQSTNLSGITSVRKLDGSSQPTGSQVAARSGALKVSRTSSVGMYLRISSR